MPTSDYAASRSIGSLTHPLLTPPPLRLGWLRACKTMQLSGHVTVRKYSHMSMYIIQCTKCQNDKINTEVLPRIFLKCLLLILTIILPFGGINPFSTAWNQ